MLSVDLNCDLGEGMSNDAAIIPHISSANISCGAHAGDRDVICQTIELALKFNVAIGAHPSFPDKENFGRINWLDPKKKIMQLKDLPDMINEQLNSFNTICCELGAKWHHIKPHGALYNHLAVDEEACRIFFQAISEYDATILIYGLSGSEMKKQAKNYDMKFVSEVFADRTYQNDGTLTPRNQQNALIVDDATALGQVLRMVRQREVVSVTGAAIPIQADSICLHGDGKRAVSFAKLIRHSLEREGIAVKSPLT